MLTNDKPPFMLLLVTGIFLLAIPVILAISSYRTPDKYGALEMTSKEKIEIFHNRTPHRGLLIKNKTINKYEFWDGQQWVALNEEKK